MNAYVDKVAAYEAAPAAGWAQGALLFADAPSTGTDFVLAADRAAGPLASNYDVGRIDLATSSVADARARMSQGLAGGASLVGYIGHGGLVETRDSVALLRPGHRLTGGRVLPGFSVPVADLFAR